MKEEGTRVEREYGEFHGGGWGHDKKTGMKRRKKSNEKGNNTRK